jgi:hypothetical protein
MRQIMLSLAVAAAVCAAASCAAPLSNDGIRNDDPKLDSADLRYLLQVLRKQLYGCWNRPAGVSGAGADAPSAIVRFRLKQDGTLAGEPVVVGSHADPSQAVAKTALAAVKRCQPLRLPPNLYEFWTEVEVNFIANAPI